MCTRVGSFVEVKIFYTVEVMRSVVGFAFAFAFATGGVDFFFENLFKDISPSRDFTLVNFQGVNSPGGYNLGS